MRVGTGSGACSRPDPWASSARADPRLEVHDAPGAFVLHAIVPIGQGRKQLSEFVPLPYQGIESRDGRICDRPHAEMESP